MPLHLLGKKSWNVYSPANVARVRADEDAAAARDAAADQRTQELDAARRAALLRGRTPPPLPEDTGLDVARRPRRNDGPDRTRRKRVGEDDTDLDIRLAASTARPRDASDNDHAVLKLRQPASDAPLTDGAGHIDLFPVDPNDAAKREKNAAAEKEKRRKEQAFEDQYTMRFANAAGKDGLRQPWYAAQHHKAAAAADTAIDTAAFESKNVWGNEDPRRKEREHARLASSDPFAVMQHAQTQLNKAREDKKRWAAERSRELEELRDAQQPEKHRKHHRRGSHRRSRSRSRSRSPHRERRHRSCSPRRDEHRVGHRRHEHSRHASSRRRRSRSPSSRRRR